MFRQDTFLSEETGAGGGPGGLPTLPSASDIQYWFEANHDVYSDAGAATPCNDGDGIYNWLNQGVAADHAVQATSGNRPTFKTGGIGGKSFIRCNPANAQFFANLVEGSQPSTVGGYNPYTVFAVVDNIRVNGSSIPALFGSNGSTSPKPRVRFLDSGGVNRLEFFKTQIVLNLTDSTGPNAICACKRSGGVQLFRKGDQGQPVADQTQSTNASSNASSGMQFLRHNNSDYFDGDLYEVIYYNDALSLTDCQDVLDYLAAKYGL